MIKRLIPLMVCLLLGGVAFAQGGVEFRDLTFDEALVKAKAEKSWFLSIVIRLGVHLVKPWQRMFSRRKQPETFSIRVLCA